LAFLLILRETKNTPISQKMAVPYQRLRFEAREEPDLVSALDAVDR
jgi:hypothetical protein